MGIIVNLNTKEMLTTRFSCILILLGSTLAFPERELNMSDDQEKYRILFDKLDQDGDGKVTQAEVFAVFQDLGFAVTEEKVAKFMDGHDNVDYQTFEDLSNNFDEDIGNVFEMYDKDSDGSIDLAEITTLLSFYVIGNAGRYLAYMDKDGDGVLNFQEF